MTTGPVVPDWRPRAESLAKLLAGDPLIHDPAWLAAVADVPRHEFVPAYYRQDTSVRPARWQRVDPSQAAERESWLSRVYSTTTLVTAVADYVGRGVQIPVSSSTKPDLMARMLQELDVTPGMRVLEIGTGTGYNAALLSHRLGAQRVFSVDVDDALVTAAAARLATIGYRPTLVAADGSNGLPDHAPYDRIIATCSVPAIPAAWITQLRVGGMILADVEGPLGAGNLVTLHRASGDHLVTGRFLPWWGRFMRLRHAAGSQVGSPRPRPAGGEVRTGVTCVDPAELDAGFRFLAQLYLPVGTVQSLVPDVDLATIAATRLVAPDGSWCEVDHGPETSTREVRHGGPRHLWDLVEDAWGMWRHLDAPAWSRFGLTATTDSHVVWLDRPDGPSWTLPR